MPINPDRPDGSEAPAGTSEATQPAVRETIPAGGDRSTAWDIEAEPDTVPIDISLDPAPVEAGWDTEPFDVPVEAGWDTDPLDAPVAADRGIRPADVPVEAGMEGSPADGSRETVLIDPGNRPTVRVGPNPKAAKVPGQRRPAGRSGRAPLLVAAGFATLWAALLSYLPVAAVIGLARTMEGVGGLGGAARAGLAGWLLGHGVPIGTAIGPLALAPLLLTLLVGWRLNRAGLHVTRAIGARHSAAPRDALLVAGAVGLCYAVLGLLAALLISGPGTEVPIGRAAITFFVIGAAGALVGSVRGTGALASLSRGIPPALRHGLRTGLVAAMLILAAGAAFAGLSVAIGGGQAADMIAAYRTGVTGQVGITLVSLAYGANGAIWAAAYLLGPGFALGTDSAVSVTEVTVGPLPTLPLLAGLPNGPMGATGALLLAVPVLAAMFAGWLLTQRLRRDPEARTPKWPLLLASAALAGPVAGVVLGLLALISGGSLGAGRLSEIGPGPWQVGLVATAVVAVSATIGAASARTFRKA
jgi:hypothetical protein